MEACLTFIEKDAFDQGYEDQLEKLGFNLKGMASSVGNFFKTQVGLRAKEFGRNVKNEAQGLLKRPTHPDLAKPTSGDEGWVPQAGGKWTGYDRIGYKGIPHLSNAALDQRISESTKHLEKLRSQGFYKNRSPYADVPGYEESIYTGKTLALPRMSLDPQRLNPSVKGYRGALPKRGWISDPTKPVTNNLRPPKTPAAPTSSSSVTTLPPQYSAVMPFRPTAVSQLPSQPVTHASQTAVRPAVTQDMLSTRVASEVNMNPYEQGYADQMIQLGLAKEAGLTQAIQGLAGKARDLGSRALGTSKATVQARRANINAGRQSVTAAKDEKMLQGVRDKYKGKVDAVKGTGTGTGTGTQYVPPPEIQAILDKYKTGPHATPTTPTPPAGTEAEGPGSWEKFKGWWGERKPWQKGAIGAGVALPVGAGLFMAGGQNPPTIAQQQYGYQPQY
jgi:hypothetical protein